MFAEQILFFGMGWLNSMQPYSNFVGKYMKQILLLRISLMLYSILTFSSAYETDFAPTLYKMWYKHNIKYK
jgi:hypothetical protein